jgi:hypothetical protein
LTVLIPLRVLLNFRIAYSSPPPSRRHQGTFKVATAATEFLVAAPFAIHVGMQLVLKVLICAR